MAPKTGGERGKKMEKNKGRRMTNKKGRMRIEEMKEQGKK
jgi:hypothetical protein